MVLKNYENLLQTMTCLFNASAGCFFTTLFIFMISGLVLRGLFPCHNVITANLNSISYFSNLTRGMSSAIGVGALRAQNTCPLAAVIAEMPWADPLATSVDLTAKAALMVAL